MFNVKANETIFVRSLSVHGANIQSQAELSRFGGRTSDQALIGLLLILGSSEFDLTIEINSACGDNPDLCPCPDDSLCPESMSDNIAVL